MKIYILINKNYKHIQGATNFKTTEPLKPEYIKDPPRHQHDNLIERKILQQVWLWTARVF